MEEPFRRHGCAILFAIVCAMLSGFSPAVSAGADPRFTILYHEPLILQGVDSVEEDYPEHDVVENLRFDAFGRRFDIHLEAHSQRDGRNRTSDFELFTGHLTSAPESWVRLMRRGDRLSGMVHDVSDIYFIEPRSTVSAALTDVEPQNDSMNVIYRLADTLIEPGMISCETRLSNEPANGRDAFTKLTAELSAANPGTTASGVPTASIGVIADLDFFTRFDSDSDSEIESLFNVVDGIFTEQVGVEIAVAESLIVASADKNPFSTTMIGSELLDELAQWRRINQAELDLTHLLTDRDLTGENSSSSIAGLSFLGVPGRAGVCFAQSGAGMSAWYGNLTALIITHEIAHNLGAPHDGKQSNNPLSASPCESTPSSGFIMSASLNSPLTDQFSPCSLQEMQKVIDAASCLSPEPVSAPVAVGDSDGGGGTLNWLSLAFLFVTAIYRRARLDLFSMRRVAIKSCIGLSG
jgi:hypothetical protein